MATFLGQEHKSKGVGVGSADVQCWLHTVRLASRQASCVEEQGEAQTSESKC